MKSVRLFSILLLAGAMLVSCSSKNTGGKTQDSTNLKGEISLSGAFALYPLAVEWAGEFQQMHPGVKIDISAGGAGKGITDALSGMVDLGMVSRELYQEEIDKGAVGIAVAKDAVVATINAKNPALKEILAHGLTPEMATRIWITGDVKTWGDLLGINDQTPIHVYTRSDACGAAETWANWFGHKQEDLKGTAVYADPGLANAVQKDIYGIGFNNIGYAYDNETHKYLTDLRVVPVDNNKNGQITRDEYFYDVKDSVTKAIGEGRYPSPPARDLYLVSKGKPSNPVVVEFLKYILSKGQDKNESVGYIRMSADKIKAGMGKVGL
ncbi:MAG: substrate-binding domain-containing protein [Bacteroidales bacterium]|nr:substrate-binding domain-containing protein [Bacteroidales bacterium]